MGDADDRAPDVKLYTCLISYCAGVHDLSEDLDCNVPSPLSRLREKLIAMGVVSYHVEHYAWEWKSISMSRGPSLQGVLPKRKSPEHIQGEILGHLNVVDFILAMGSQSKRSTDADPFFGYIEYELKKLNRLRKNKGFSRTPIVVLNQAGDLIMRNREPFLLSKL